MVKNKFETNIVVFGKPFAGVNTVGDLIVKYGYQFSKTDFDFLVFSLYNDFKRINNFDGQMRYLVRYDTIMKNAEFLYRSIGIPEYISAQKMYEWTRCIDDKMHPLDLKRKMIMDMNELYPLWRSIFTREKMIEDKTKNHVLVHPASLEEAKYRSDYLLVLVEASDANCLYHAHQSKKVLVSYQDVLDRYSNALFNKLYKEADFKLSNNGDKDTLAEQVCNLLYLLGCLKGTVKIGTANDKQRSKKGN